MYRKNSQGFWENKKQFDLNEHPRVTKYFEINKNVIGNFKDGRNGIIVNTFVAVTYKLFSY